MRVIIDNIVYSLQKIGGISCVFFELTKRILKDDRYSVCFLDQEKGYDNFYRRKLDDISAKQSLFYRFRNSFFERFLNPKLNIKSSYIFHSSYYRVSRDRSAINLTTVHDFVYERYGLQGWRGKLHQWQQKYAVLHSDAVICISENTKKDLLFFYRNINPNNVFVVYNGVSEDYFHIENIAEVKLPFTPKSYCVYVGSRISYKNFLLAVKSCAYAKMKMVIIGSPLSVEEKKYVNSLLGDDNYACLSNVSNSKLNEIYNGAFCLLYLSSYEGFGIPCLEAQRAGCPVISYNSSSIPEVMASKDMMITELSVDAVSRLISNLQEPLFRERIVSEGIKFAKQFSWDKCYEETTKIYNIVYQKYKK